MADANLKETLAGIDKSIAKYEKAIQRGKDLESLKTDPRFISVFVEGYLATEAERLFEMLTAVPAIRKETMETTHDKLEAVRHLKEYIGTDKYPGIVLREAENAPDLKLADEIYRKEVTAEDSETTEEEG